jgi:hypothetical protein
MTKTHKVLKNTSKNKLIDKPHKYIFSDIISTSNLNTKLDLTSNLQSISTIRILPQKLINNKAVVIKALQADDKYFDSISNELKDDIDVGKIIMEKNPEKFKFLSEKLRDNKEFGIKAVKKSPPLYNVLSERLKIDNDILKITDFTEVIGPSYNLKKKIDKPKILSMLKILGRYDSFNVNILINVTDDVLNDKKIIIKTIRLSKMSYESIPNHLKKDDDVIETLIKNKKFDNSDLIKYLPGYNKNIALLTMRYHPDIYPHLHSDFKNDKQVILAALKSNTKESNYGYFIRDILPYIPDNMKLDKDIQDILESNKNNYYFSKKKSDDKRFVLKNVHRWNTFKFISNRLKSDKNVVISALTNPARSKYEPDTLLTFTSPKIYQDKDVFLKSLENRIKVNKKTLSAKKIELNTKQKNIKNKTKKQNKKNKSKKRP